MTLGPVRSLPRRAALAAASIFLISAGAMAATPPTQAVAASTGDHATAVVLVTFTDNASQPKTVAETDALVFGDVSDFLWENSYQQNVLIGQTFGWYPIPMAASNCDTMAIAREADRAATAAGANLAPYKKRIDPTDDPAFKPDHRKRQRGVGDPAFRPVDKDVASRP